MRCKDGLGDGGGEAFLPGRFNHAAKASPEHPDQDQTSFGLHLYFGFLSFSFQDRLFVDDLALHWNMFRTALGTRRMDLLLGLGD